MTTISPLASTNLGNQPQLVQTTLHGSMKRKAAPAFDVSKKRKLAFGDGGELDLTTPLPMTPEVMEALKNRIFELEDELEAQQSSAPAAVSQAPAKPTKKARVSAASETAEASSSTAVTPAQAAKDDKKRKMQVKKIIDQLKKECKAAGVKFQGAPKTVKFDEVLEPSEFQSLFGGHGTLIQPTPTNKPTSTVTIMDFNQAQVFELLGPDCTKNLKGNLWTRGGAPTFAKSVKMGMCDLDIHSLNVSYSKNNMKCTLKFEVEDVDGDESRGGVLGPSGGGGRRGMWVLG
ncbi:hypothetical protein BKA70DRAFT_1339607 [Coprinopsis sp. MPI-PUGE-AT-0042]|nr:hypothetical protein BKA70DRAFT_1339607 [Coprinopsis sp. MPI-PUGE-AT-0042]